MIVIVIVTSIVVLIKMIIMYILLLSTTDVALKQDQSLIEGYLHEGRIGIDIK